MLNAPKQLFGSQAIGRQVIVVATLQFDDDYYYYGSERGIIKNLSIRYIRFVLLWNDPSTDEWWP